MSVLVNPLQTFKKSDKNLNFSNYGKSHIYIYVEYKFQAIMWARGAKTGTLTGDINGF